MKQSFRRQIIPPLVGLMTMLGVLVGLNGPTLWSRFSYLLQDPKISAKAWDTDTLSSQNSQQADPSKPSKIIIEKINKELPIIYSRGEADEKSFQIALRGGVVHYPQTALPGEGGNTVIFGHSSGAAWRPGSYKQAFTLLDKLTTGDMIKIEYQAITYKYQVKNTRIVLPTEVSVLQPSTRPKLTLITCYPVGTNEKRFIIEAEQISPIITNNTSSQTKAPMIKSLPPGELYLFPSIQAPWDN